MLVQVRQEGLRLIRQPDHARLAAELARSWRGTEGREGALPLRLVVATALHDAAWWPLDEAPRFDSSTGRPFAFHDHPLPEKLAAYREGLDRLEALDPYAALLGSLHYASFLDETTAPEFLAGERKRRERLEPEVDRRAAEEELAWLKCFDDLSIRLCLTSPGHRPEELPSWLDPDARVPVPGQGPELSISWSRDGVGSVAPWPFGPAVTCELPARELDRVRYPDAGELQRAWRAAERRTWRLTLRPPG